MSMDAEWCLVDGVRSEGFDLRCGPGNCSEHPSTLLTEPVEACYVKDCMSASLSQPKRFSRELARFYGLSVVLVICGKSLVLLTGCNIQDYSLKSVEQGVPLLFLLYPFITSSCKTALPLCVRRAEMRTELQLLARLLALIPLADVRIVDSLVRAGCSRFIVLSRANYCSSPRDGWGCWFDAPGASVREETVVGAGSVSSREFYVPEWAGPRVLRWNDGKFVSPEYDCSHFILTALFSKLSVEWKHMSKLFTESMRRTKGFIKECEVSNAQKGKGIATVHGLTKLRAKARWTGLEKTSLVDQVHELEVSSTDLREKLEMYEELLKWLEEYQDNLMEPLRTRLAEIDADFTRCCMRFQDNLI
ncbi:hypothetical protein Tco_0645442 [Tanacetum coccineum]